MALTKPPPVHQRSSLSLSGGKATEGQQQTIAEQTPPIDVEQTERNDPVAGEEQADAAGPRSPSTSQHDGVPIFPDTRDGRATRLAYYEARKLNNPRNSLLD